MSTPKEGDYNFELKRRQDWQQQITYTDGNNNPNNLTGYTPLCQVWNYERTKKYADMTVTISDAQNGIIDMSLTDAQTSILPDLSYYDLRVTISTTSYYVIGGTITTTEGYTA